MNALRNCSWNTIFVWLRIFRKVFLPFNETLKNKATTSINKKLKTHRVAALYDSYSWGQFYCWKLLASGCVVFVLMQYQHWSVLNICFISHFSALDRTDRITKLFVGRVIIHFVCFMIFTFVHECLMSEVKWSRGLQALIKQTVENGYFAFFLSFFLSFFARFPFYRTPLTIAKSHLNFPYFI